MLLMIVSDKSNLIFNARETWATGCDGYQKDNKTGNSKYTHNDNLSKFTPELQYIYKVNDDSSFYAKIGKSFRLPNLTQIFGNGNMNPALDLKPEQGTHYEIGYKSNIGKGNLRFAVFNYKIKDSIDADVKYDKDGNEIAANGLGNYINNDGTLKANSGLYINGNLATQDDVDKMVDSSKTFDTGALTLKLHVGADATDNNQISVKIDAMSADGLGVKNLKVDGADDTNAKNAVETIKEAIQKVSTQRSALGAVQNRLEHTINNLDNVVENTTSAESQIRDTDMATEMVKYSNNNILAQAGQAMLAQSNQANQGVLSLLQ